ncbi:MAG: hypothetical protein WBE34_15955 [Candidatus Nitrosopolaris sp.]
MKSSSLFPSLLSIPVIIIIIIFLIWYSIPTLSEGQSETTSIIIKSPTNGQNISIGSNLTISGIATGTNTTSANTGNNRDGNRCYVSVIVNNIKPYQNATADGPNGVNDYSKWYYTLSIKFAAIKDGQNKLTGKLSCLRGSSINTNATNVSNTTNNLIKWYSVNVTGVSTSSTINRNNQTTTNSTIDRPQHPQSKTEGNATMTSNSTSITSASHSKNTSNSTSPSIKENNGNKITTSGGSLSAKLTQSPSTSKSTSDSNYDNNNAKPLSISTHSSQNIVNGKGTSTIAAIAYDANTAKKINNAIVKLKIVFTSNGTSKEIVSHSGEITYSVEIQPNSNNSNISFKATIQAFAPGYISAFKSSSSSTSTSTTTSNSNSYSNSYSNDQ